MVIVLAHTIASAYLYIRNPDKFGVHSSCDEKSEASPRIQGSVSGCKQSYRRGFSDYFCNEEAYLPLLEAKTIPELRLAVRNALSSIITQLDHVVVYLKNPLTGIVEADGGKTLPTEGLLWHVFHQEDVSVTECPTTLLDPLSDSLGLSEEEQETHSVICVPVPGKSDEGSIGIIAASFENGISVNVHDSRFEYLKKQTSVCYQLIKSSTAIRRKSVCESDSHIESLIGLCGELYDQDAASLQIKVIKYLQQRTQAQSAFLLLVVPDTQELFCQVVGSKVLQEEFRFPGQTSCFALALEKKKPITLDDLPKDNRRELYDIAGSNIKSFLCVPVRRKGAEDLIALACVLNKRGSEKFCGDDAQAIRKCFQYTATVLTSTLAFQNERKLKNQTQALLHVARKLFTRLGEYMNKYNIACSDNCVVKCGRYQLNIRSLKQPEVITESESDTQFEENLDELLQKQKEIADSLIPDKTNTKKKLKYKVAAKVKTTVSTLPEQSRHKNTNQPYTKTKQDDLTAESSGFLPPIQIPQPSSSSSSQGFETDMTQFAEEEAPENKSQKMSVKGADSGSDNTMYTPKTTFSSSTTEEDYSSPLSSYTPDMKPLSLTPNSMYYYTEDDSSPRRFYEVWPSIEYGKSLKPKTSQSDSRVDSHPDLPDVVASYPAAQTSFSEPYLNAEPSSIESFPSESVQDTPMLMLGNVHSSNSKGCSSTSNDTLRSQRILHDHGYFVDNTKADSSNKKANKVLSISKLHINPSSHIKHILDKFTPESKYMQKIQVPQITMEILDENDLTKLLREIMQEARNLTQAERCSVFLIDDQDLVAKVFDGISAGEQQIEQEIVLPKSQGIAGHVATTGQLLNIKDAYSHPLFYRGIDDSTGFRTRNILCFPIKNEDEVVLGVAQLCNKKTGPCFTQFDEDIASAFAVYCCISISHCLMYRKTQEAHHRNRLANELMIFHMKVTYDEVKVFDTEIQSVYTIHPDFDKFSYPPRILSEEETPKACLSMFEDLGFISKFRIKRDCLIRFTLMVKRGYRNPPYHNWMHAYSVAHFCYLLIKNLKLEEILGDIQVFALFVSCLCHDIDHRGTTNSFQVESQSVLAALYSSEGSVMERHHFAQSMCILNTEGCNIFENLSSMHYTQVLDLMRDIILATDLAHHLRILKSLKELANNGFDKDNPKDLKLLLCLSMTACDLSDQTKNWKNTKQIASLVYQEFFSQGDLEKALGQNPLEMMDRDRACIPDLQISFLDNIALPVYEIQAKIFPEAQEVLQNVLNNRSRWEKIGQLLKLRRGNSTQQLSVEQIIALDSDSEEFDVLKKNNSVNGR